LCAWTVAGSVGSTGQSSSSQSSQRERSRKFRVVFLSKGVRLSSFLRFTHRRQSTQMTRLISADLQRPGGMCTRGYWYLAGTCSDMSMPAHLHTAHLLKHSPPGLRFSLRTDTAGNRTRTHCALDTFDALTLITRVARARIYSVVIVSRCRAPPIYCTCSTCVFIKLEIPIHALFFSLSQFFLFL